MSRESTPAPAGRQAYRDFLAKKTQLPDGGGFEPAWMPPYLYGFQAHLTGWAIRRGRASIMADCGLGKTPMAFVYGENVVRKTNKPVLYVTTLGDSAQAVREADKFHVDAVRSRDGKLPPGGARIVVTNYERLRLFDPAHFGGGIFNEASCIKDFDGGRRAEVTEWLRTLPYRLLLSATAAPNDYVELGCQSEALGELGWQDMVSRFFHKQLAARGTIGWGAVKYRMRRHAERPFWQWVASWARACRKPSDLGFDDGGFDLPPLEIREHAVKSAGPPPGWLYEMPAVGLAEQRVELKRTLRERCERVAALVAHDRPALVWCHLNPEGDLLERLIPGAVQTSGRDSDDEREEKFDAFASGQARVMISKPKIAGHGLNWQHCAHETFFPSHSWEQWYQAVRRCWRFGQTRPVVVDVVTTEGMRGVLANLQRKSDQADAMFRQLVSLMNEFQGVERAVGGTRNEEVPAWLS